MGEENVPNNAPSRKFLGPSKYASGLVRLLLFYKEKRAATPEGGGKRTERWGSKPTFGRGVIREVFLPPPFSRGQKLNTNYFFLKLFGHRRDIPAKSRDIPPKKFNFPGFEGHTELFGPHPFTWKTPTPPEQYPDSKVWVCALFSRLIFQPPPPHGVL